MKEVMMNVNHEQAVKLLHNKFVVVLGDSIQRGVYKDLVLMLQKEKYLATNQLKSKGEMSFEQDCLVQGGLLRPLHNGTEYKEVRQFQSDHHLVRFYFVTRIYSSYMRTILNDFHQGLKPDVVIVNSCVWDISRYDSEWTEDYKENLHLFFSELNGVLPMETLVIWNVTMPLAEKIKGGFLVPEIEHKAAQLRYDIIEANFYGGTVAECYNLDVLDLHFQFRFFLQHRTKDGVHWNAIAHRRISSLLLQHIAEAWGVVLSSPLTSAKNIFEQRENEKRKENPGSCHEGALLHHHPPPNNYFSDSGRAPFTNKPPAATANSFHREDFYSDSLLPEYTSFEKPRHRPHQHHLPRSRNATSDGHRCEAYEERHQYVMKSRHRHHCAPYGYHRPRNYDRHNYHYYY